MLLLLFIKHIKTIYMIDFFYSEKIKIPMYEAFMWNGEQFKTMLPGVHHIHMRPKALHNNTYCKSRTCMYLYQYEFMVTI